MKGTGVTKKIERRFRLKPDGEPIAVASLRTRAGSVYVLCSVRGLREVRLGRSSAPTKREAREKGVHYVRRPRWTGAAVRALERFVDGAAIPSDLPLDLSQGTTFQRKVWDATRAVPWGEVVSYREVAKRAGYPKAVRAVGNALGANPVPIVVPCHRVVHVAGSIGGFTSGLDWKRFLLSLERGQLELAWRRKRLLGLFRT
jgi:methylated-DNA-[protein]-cysteine S-methyltransferase